MLKFQNIHVSFGTKEILHGVDLSAAEHQITGIIGPNGCGKSTLIKTLFDIVPMQEGTIHLYGREVSEYKRQDIAKYVGYVGQESSAVFDFTVEEIIGMSLYNQKLRKEESRQRIQSAMEELEITQFYGRSIQQLSGGERKMVYLARAIASGAEIIILDEPTNHLDIRHQLFLLNYLKQSGKTILIVIHDLRLAAHYCDQLYLMKSGNIIDSGCPQKVLTRENTGEIFGIFGEMQETSNGGDFIMDFKIS